MVRLTGSMVRSAALRALVMALAGVAALPVGARAAEPRPWELGMQPSATPVHERIAYFHDVILVPVIILISIFVLGLLVYVMVRFHHTRNSVPTRTSHNPVIEVLWTVVPVVILVLIAIPSFKLMYYMDRVPKAAMTIKVTGNQWYWTYEYPDQKISFNSNLIADKDLKPGQLRLLSVDNPLVVPAGENVRVQVTGAPDGVIHSWFVPSFGVQEYAVPGRLNEAWFRVDHPGTYYGECNQICGINHSHMPIEVDAVTPADFQKWLGVAKQKFAVAAPGDEAPAAASPAQLVVAGAERGERARFGHAPAGN